ncbi:hypothetical protein J2S17_000109 [Cytobacillus purgationiresistens]|uniref:Uncharacterized protein n=1 Tax=Cytobacillus purgationiresistens TaxID=863449 RepID=A0ABU0AAG5_9BACI|nr:hypothetical protein [Cytobacillus purgationiresistens]
MKISLETEPFYAETGKEDKSAEKKGLSKRKLVKR